MINILKYNIYIEIIMFYCFFVFMIIFIVIFVGKWLRCIFILDYYEFFIFNASF